MKLNKQVAIKVAKYATDTAIKNSEIVQPYVKPSHYRRGLTALNMFYLALRFFDK